MSGREVIEAAAERSRVTWQARVARLRRLAPTLLHGRDRRGGGVVHRDQAGRRGGRVLRTGRGDDITLGLTVGSQLNRAIELWLGVPLGIALADVLVLQIGSGTWQLIGIVFLATSIAVFLGGGPLLVTQAAVSAILVVTLQPPTDGLSFTRAADALIVRGGAAAQLRDRADRPHGVGPARGGAGPRRAGRGARRHRRRPDRPRSRPGGRRAAPSARHRRLHPAFLEALTIGRETAAAAPARRVQREPMAIYSEGGGQIDLAVRNVRVLARGVVRAIDTGDRVPPAVADALGELRQAVLALAPWLEDPRRVDAVIEPAVKAARHASAVLEQTTNLSVSVIIGQVRSTAADLMRTTGAEPEEARAPLQISPPERADHAVLALAFAVNRHSSAALKTVATVPA